MAQTLDTGRGVSNSSGHRQRLRERFLAGAESARTESALLELLLTFAIPQQDVAPLAHTLLERFGDLSRVLAADPSQLTEIAGVKASATTLLKLVDGLRTHYPAAPAQDAGAYRSHRDEQTPPNMARDMQLTFFAAPAAPVASVSAPPSPRPSHHAPTPRSRSEVFTTAYLREAIKVLPLAPDTGDDEEVRAFLRRSLPFNAVQTRQRVSEYIMRRMFPAGEPDRALLRFAHHYAERQDWRDVAFYRFCQAEPLMYTLIEDLLLSEIGVGSVERRHVRVYLTMRFPESGAILKCIQAFADALGPAGIARTDKTHISFAYRDIPLAAFVFVLHSEFPQPGMYDIGKLERSRAVRALLWNPERILSMLYELRNRGILSKVSEIDSVRQFTTRLTLDEAVAALVASAQTAGARG